MIISHKHRFIFLHGRKTAGTSIGISLMRHLGSGDVVRGYIHGGLVEGVVPPDFHGAWRRAGPLGVAQALRSLRIARRNNVDLGRFRSSHEAFKVFVYREYVKRAFGVTGTHLGCSAVRELVGAEVWERYYKFTFERDPFDRMVSFYFWRTKGFAVRPVFLDFVRAVHDNDASALARLNAAGFSNTTQYMIDDSVAVDFIGRFENLDRDVGAVFREIGLEYDGWLPRNKTGVRKSPGFDLYHRHPEAIELVASLARTEIELLNYSIPASPIR